MLRLEVIKTAVRSASAYAPLACADDLARISVLGDLDRALRLPSPLCRVTLRTDHDEITGTIDLVNYSDAINHERLRQGVCAMALRMLRPGCELLQVSIEVVDANNAAERPSWRALLAKRYRGALVHEQWNVAAGHVSSDSDNLHSLLKGLAWMPHPRPLTFDADPFVAEVQGRSWLLYEHIDQRNHGEIWCRELLPSGPGAARPLLQLPTHLSYPYIFDHDGRTYMLPENSAGGQTFAYELIGPELQLGTRHTLLEDVGVVDPSLVCSHGRWWLFGGIAGLADNAALFAWHADSPFGPFTPHSLNPLKVDARSSRPGGTMWHSAGRLLRPAQNCSVRYGGSITVMHVSLLTPTEFEESAQVDLASPSSNYCSGLHTLSRHGNLWAIDGLRDVVTHRKLATLLG